MATVEVVSSVEDHKYVLNDPNRVDIGVILVHILNSGADLNSISKMQERLSSKMPEGQIKGVLDEWLENGYAEFSGEGKYQGTEKLSEALKRINVTKERLVYLSKL